MIDGVRVDVGRKNEFGRFVVFEAESFGEEVVTLLGASGERYGEKTKVHVGKRIIQGQY